MHRFHAGLLSLVVLALLQPVPAAAQHAASLPAAPLWPVTGGGPLRQGYTNLRLPTTGKVRWSIELPGGGLFGSSPVVDAQQRIFLVANDSVTSSPLSILYCLDREGNVLWLQHLSDRFDFHPVLLSSGNLLAYSFSKQLYAFSPTGELLWRRQYSASPRIGDDEVWANYSSGLSVPTQVQALPDRDGGVLVVDDSPALLRVDSEGRKLWETRLFGSCAGGLMLFNGVVYVPACDGRIHVYRASDGRELPNILLGGVSPFYPTGWPGGGVLSMSAGGLGERLVLLPAAGVRGFEFPFDMKVRTPLTVNARSEFVAGLGLSGSTDGREATRGQLVGLTSAGKLAWTRNFSTVPSGQIIADPSGRYCFGSLDVGSPGVYQLNPQRGVEWWISTAGASQIFPIADGLLGVLVVSERKNVDKNKCLLLAVGN